MGTPLSPYQECHPFLLSSLAHDLVVRTKKVMIIDLETVITGSFNFTKAAEENNAENLLVIHDMKLAER
jgi:phosphatidylserine/phosphatidylglycerophosphate/cardiolipin synthase-like enzyme